MLRSIITILALSLPTSVLSAASFNVVMNYKMTEEAAAGFGCAEYKEELGKIRDEALVLSGLVLVGNSDQWISENPGQGNGGGNGNDNSNGGQNTPPGPDTMDAKGCDKTCKWMCAGTLQEFWCDCCSCCDVRETQRYLKGNPNLDTEQIQVKAALAAKELLEVQGLNIACLDPSYEVSVTVEDGS